MNAISRRPVRPFRLTPPVVPENDLHVAVADLLAKLVLPPAMWTCFPSGNVPLPAQYAAKLSRMGLRRGWPDFILIHEWAHGIELKRRGGRLSRTRLVRTARGSLRELEGQEDTFPRLMAAGMGIEVCCSPDEVLAALRKWGIPLRTIAA
jgi:hypothetical protein